MSFEKQDLQTGMEAVCRNGEIRTVLLDYMGDLDITQDKEGKGYISLSDYTDKLKNGCGSKKWDVMEVYAMSFGGQRRDRLYKRNEQITIELGDGLKLTGDEGKLKEYADIISKAIGEAK